MICPHCACDLPTLPPRCPGCGRSLGGERPTRSPLVGRARALARLDEALDEARKTRSPRFLAVRGAPRSGRSRLLAEFLRRHDNAFSDVRAVRGFPVPGGRVADPFQPLGRVLHNALGLDDQEAPEAARARVEKALAALDPPSLPDAVRGVAFFLGRHLAEGDAALALEAGPDELRRRAFAVFGWLLRKLAERRPLIVALEGGDEAGPEAWELLGSLRPALEGRTVLLLVEIAPDPATERDVFDGAVEVEPLDRSAVAELMKKLADRAALPPANLLDAVVTATDGRPEAVVHVVDTLYREGILTPDGLGWGVDADAEVAFDFPLTPRQAARQRLGALDDEARAALRLGAVVGPVFWRGALVPLLRAGQGVHDALTNWIEVPDPARLSAALERCAEAGVVQPRPESALPDDVEYAFTRARERELLLDEVEDEARPRLHALVAQWLEAHRASGDLLLRPIAEHYRHAGSAKRAAFFFLRAGDEARSRFANDTAIECYEQALTLLDARDGLALMDVHHALGALHALAGRHDRAEAAFERMLATAWQLDHRAKAGAALNRLGRLLRDRCQLARADDVLERGRALFAEARDVPGVAASIDDLGQVALLRGDRARAEALFKDALTHRQRAGDPRAVALSLTNLARLWRDAGARRRAEAALEEALTLRQRLGDVAGELDTRLERVELLLRDRRAADALQEAETALEMARATGNRGRRARGLALAALAAAALDDHAAAGQRAREAVALAEQLGDVHSRVRALRAQALAELGGGEAEVALAHLTHAERLARTHGDRVELVECLLIEARLRGEQVGVDLGEAARVARAQADATEADDDADGDIAALIDDALKSAEDTVPPEVLALPDEARAALGAAAQAAIEAVDTLDALGDAARAAEVRRTLALLAEAQGDVGRGRRLRREAEALEAGDEAPLNERQGTGSLPRVGAALREREGP
ncbi:MAG: tetratricopeptide repeat protein [Myxococcales bacterium]|nr:tetratricopeptide repeat protein [Myxococcales bacterium]